jgi:hypothetical protein
MIAIFFSAILLIIHFDIVPLMEEKNEIRDNELKNDLYKLYTQLDPDIIHQNIDNLIDKEIAKYMVINIRTRESHYMNSQDIDTMVKNVSANIYLNLSDMYITFIKLVYNVNSADDLIIFINDAVKMRAIDVVTENNKLI